MTPVTEGKPPPPLPYYVPTANDKRIRWLGKLVKGLPIYAPACDISGAEIESAVARINNYIYYDEFHRGIEKVYQDSCSYKLHLGRGASTVEMAVPILQALAFIQPTQPPGLFDYLVSLINRIKASAGYNPETVGRELEIVRVHQVRNEHPYPVFTLALVQGKTRMVVRIDFMKYGHPAVAIECRINGGTWEPLGINNSRPHIDDRELLVANVPETREYRMRWWDKGAPHGDWSPILSISVMP